MKRIKPIPDNRMVKNCHPRTQSKVRMKRSRTDCGKLSMNTNNNVSISIIVSQCFGMTDLIWRLCCHSLYPKYWDCKWSASFGYMMNAAKVIWWVTWPFNTWYNWLGLNIVSPSWWTESIVFIDLSLVTFLESSIYITF